MRKIVTAFLLILPISLYAGTTQDYKSYIERCDEQFEKESKSDFSTVEIVRTINNHTECYRKIAYKIINENYTKQSEDMKSNFNDYIKASGTMTGYINRPDSCYPQCGTIVGIDSANSALNAAKKYLENLLQDPESH